MLISNIMKFTQTTKNKFLQFLIEKIFLYSIKLAFRAKFAAQRVKFLITSFQNTKVIFRKEFLQYK